MREKPSRGAWAYARWLLLLSGALAAIPVQAETTRLRVSGGLSVGYDDNVGAAQANPEKEGSALASMLLAADYTWLGTDFFALLLRGQLNGEAVERFEDLSNGRALAMIRATIKPGGGFYTPVFSLWTSAGRLEYGSRIRTGSEYRGGLLGTVQLSTRVAARAELKGFHRRSEGEVFDLSGQAGVLGLNWVPAPRLSLSTAFEYQTGDSVSSTAPSPRARQAAEVLEFDDAFGGAEGSHIAYRFEARTRIASVGFNYRLTRDLALDGQLQAISVDADFGNQYDRLTGLVGLLFRF